MLRPILPGAVALALLTGTLNAAQVEFRLIERRGQTSWDPAGPQSPLNDNILNLAVQARVAQADAANQAIGEFSFNIVLPGEAESAGALARSLISNADGTYSTSAAQYDANATVGRGGLAAAFTYLAGINPSLNGVINASSGTWTQTPDQDIGLVHGLTSGNTLVLFLVDPPPILPYPTPLDPAVTEPYFGANGHWVDVYHFNYTLTDMSRRPLRFSLTDPAARVFSGIQLNNGVWAPSFDAAPSVTVADLTVAIVPSVGTAATLMLGAIATRRRR